MKALDGCPNFHPARILHLQQLHQVSSVFHIFLRLALPIDLWRAELGRKCFWIQCDAIGGVHLMTSFPLFPQMFPSQLSWRESLELFTQTLLFYINFRLKSRDFIYNPVFVLGHFTVLTYSYTLHCF